MKSAKLRIQSNIKLVFLLALVFSLMAVPLKAVNFTITGKVATAANVGIPDVVVSDGLTVTKTNSSGQYTLSSNDLAKFVFVSVPADCKIPHSGNIPNFYKDIKGTKSNITVNFTLEKQAKDDYFVLQSMADPQPQTAADLKRFVNEAVPDFEQLKQYYPANTTFVGMTAGDNVWDMPSFYPTYKTALGQLSFPYFQVIGNHDHDEKVKNNDYLAARNFEDHFGPTYYSFNRGDCHFITLDNIMYRTRTDYDETITQEQLDWLQQDLSHVSKDKMIVIGMHCPAYSSATKPKATNAPALIALLNGYKAIIISGHTHKMNYVKINSNITEYTLAPTMGYAWAGDIHTNGCPMGYGVFEFQGNQLVNHYYMSTKRHPDYQMRLYQPGAISSYPNSMVAHVWNYKTGWTVRVWEDDVAKGTMTKVTATDPFAYDYFIGSDKPVRRTDLEPTTTPTIFLYSPKDKTAEIRVEVTDEFGNVYTEYLNKRSESAAYRQVFFTETGGEGGGGGANLLTWTGWHNEGLAYDAGDCPQLPDLRDTYPSSDPARSQCTDKASGANNIYFKAETPTGEMRGFAIHGIDASKYKNIELSFTYNKQSAGKRGEMDVYFWNGIKWEQIWSQLIEEEEAAGWYQSPAFKLPASAEVNDLKLRFVKPPTTNGSIRMDDIWLTGEPKVSHAPNVQTASNVKENAFDITWDAYGDVNQYIVDVSEYESFSADEESTVLAAWTFPTAYSASNNTPDMYSPNNQSKTITATTTGNEANPSLYSAGSETNAENPLAVSSTGWNQGVYKKYFQIDVDTRGFYGLTLSSWHYSSANGPKDMKVQYRIAPTAEWIDVPLSDLIMPQAAYGTSSKLEDLPLPSACDNQEKLAIRWIMTSSLLTSGQSAYIVTSGGTSRIANIYVKGKAGHVVSGYESLLVSDTQQTISGLKAETDYYYRVRATDGTNVSVASDVKTAQTDVHTESYVKTYTDDDVLAYFNQQSNEFVVRLVHLKTPVATSVKLLDMNGRALLNRSMPDSELHIDASQLPTGTYILSLNIDGFILHKKCIK